MRSLLLTLTPLIFIGCGNKHIPKCDKYKTQMASMTKLYKECKGLKYD